MAITWKKIAFETDVITKATFTTKGDVLVTTGASTPIRLAIGTNTHVLTADSGEASGVKWAAAAGGAATKEFFVPVTTGESMSDWGNYPVCKLINNGDAAFTAFRVPHDFSSITTAEVVVICESTQAAANWDLYSHYAAVGEIYYTHVESDEATTYNVTDEEIEVVDISGILTALAADDYVGIQFIIKNNAHDAYVLGVHFKYS